MRAFMDALALPVSFIHPMAWHVIVGLKAFLILHWRGIVVWGLRWVAAAVFFTLLWSIVKGGWRDDISED